MGRSYTPKFRIEYVSVGCGITKACWDGKFYGKPTVASLTKHAVGLNDSFKPGGVNEHVSKSFPGARVTSARVVRQADGEVIVTWSAL